MLANQIQKALDLETKQKTTKSRTKKDCMSMSSTFFVVVVVHNAGNNENPYSHIGTHTQTVLETETDTNSFRQDAVAEKERRNSEKARRGMKH